MKKILGIIIFATIVTSCFKDSYSELNFTSVSDFEYGITQIKDSLVLSTPFYGGYYGGYTVYNSKRNAENEPLTGGFALSMKRDSSLVLKAENEHPEYTMFAKNAAGRSDACAVFYQSEESLMPEHDIVFTHSEFGTCAPVICTIVNTQQTLYNIKESEKWKFIEGDYLKLIITGIAEGKETGKVEYFLADFRKAANGGAAPDSVLTKWRTINLAKLGNVEYVDLKLETNKEGFPTFVCMDNFVANIHLKM